MFTRFRVHHYVAALISDFPEYVELYLIDTLQELKKQLSYCATQLSSVSFFFFSL